MTSDPRPCPHCGSHLSKWLIPEGASWTEEFFLVCFNDECPYYREGWAWMQQQYGQHASYRYARNPRTGVALMIPVWSDAATREQIVDEAEGSDS